MIVEFAKDAEFLEGRTIGTLRGRVGGGAIRRFPVNDIAAFTLKGEK